MSRVNILDLGLQEYKPIYAKMREFTLNRSADTLDEFWCVQHPSVFTLGANGDSKNLLKKSNIPLVPTDRGGQITYHGPGQVIIYLLVDLRRKSIGVKQLVASIEKSIVDLLHSYKLNAVAREDAHGVYIDGEKIASLGLRVSKGCSYHGLALNVDMDLNPFAYINPCGFAGMKVTQLHDHLVELDFQKVQRQLLKGLCTNLNFNI